MSYISVLGIDQGKGAKNKLGGAMALVHVYKDHIELKDYVMFTNTNGDMNYDEIREFILSLKLSSVDVVMSERQFIPKGQGHGDVIHYNNGIVDGMLFMKFPEKFATVSPQRWISATGAGSRKTDRLNKVKSLGCVVNGDMIFNGLWDAILIAYYGGKLHFARKKFKK